MKYKNRLYLLRDNRTQADMARDLGMSQQNYANYENGVSGLRSDLIERICTLYGCTAEWLLGFDGTDDNEASIEIHPEFIDVPIYGHIAAGTPIEMLEVDKTHPVPTAVMNQYPDSFLLEIEGESMNRILPNGCYALVNPCHEVSMNGKPYAVCVNGYDATVKRVELLNNGFKLVPDSTDPTYASQIFNYNEPGTDLITVIGRVVYYVLPFDWSF